MYYGKINELDIANGKGVRVSLFVSGCRNHCKGCFQPETWDFCFGQPFTTDTENTIIQHLSKPFISGLTLLGGDPMEPENQEVLLGFLKRVKQQMPNKDIWCYTGYTLEQLLDETTQCHCGNTVEMLSLIDVLVDGRFIENQRDISLKYCGSTNQRVIDVQQTLKNHKIVVYE